MWCISFNPHHRDLQPGLQMSKLRLKEFSYLVNIILLVSDSNIKAYALFTTRMTPYKAVVSRKADFVPRGQLATSVDTSGCHNLGVGLLPAPRVERLGGC